VPQVSVPRGAEVETVRDQVTLRAVTQIAPGGLWVSAAVQVDLD